MSDQHIAVMESPQWPIGWLEQGLILPVSNSKPAAWHLTEICKLHELAAWLQRECWFDHLMLISGYDPAASSEVLWVWYHFYSYPHHVERYIMVQVPKADAVVPTLTDLYPMADWLERETAEMFGITFLGHPDPRKLLLPDDWVGHPLRKDYQQPETYHDLTVAYDARNQLPHPRVGHDLPGGVNPVPPQH